MTEQSGKRPSVSIGYAMEEAITALREARKFILTECPHAPTEIELGRVQLLCERALADHNAARKGTHQCDGERDWCDDCEARERARGT